MVVLASTFAGSWVEDTRSEHLVQSLPLFNTPNRHVVHPLRFERHVAGLHLPW